MTSEFPTTKLQDERFAEAKRLNRGLRSATSDPIWYVVSELLIEASVYGQISFERVAEAVEQYLAESASDGPDR